MNSQTPIGFLMLVLGLSTPVSASAAPLVGSDDLASVTQSILASCSGATGITPSFSTSSAAEAALRAGTQEVAPMTRFLEPALTCTHATPKEAEGVIFGLDAAVALGAATEVNGCQLAFVRSVPVTDQNGTPGLDCQGCSAGTYQLTDWRDALRLLLAGMSRDASADLALQQCNSDLRYSLANSWPSLFQQQCLGSTCTTLRHVFRPADTADVSATLLSLLGLPQVKLDPAGRPISTPFCNGGTYEDNDPIRRPCTAEEAVCAADGTLGLLLPVAPPKGAPLPASYPVEPCSIGAYDWKPAPEAELSTCPGGGVNVFTLCLVPGRALPGGSLSHQCLKLETNDTPFLTPNTVNTKAYNKYLRNPNGSLVLDDQRREVYGAFYRVHSVRTLAPAARLCTELGSQEQLGCLPQASRCSLSLARRVASNQAGVNVLNVNGIAPSDANIRKLVAKPLPSDVYPLSSKLLMNTMVGSEEIVNVSQKNLYACFGRQLFADPALTNAGYVPLQQNGICQDFDERQCGAIFNKNNCKKGINFCPSIGFVFAFPLQVAVGNDITVSASASDIDDPFEDLQFNWSASFGTFADVRALATSYRCTQVGSTTLTLTIWDGACDDVFTVPVTCVAP